MRPPQPSRLALLKQTARQLEAAVHAMTSTKSDRDTRRRQDTRRKIEAGGLIAKIGLLDEDATVLLGGLSAIKKRLDVDPEYRARLLAEGTRVWKQDRAEAESA